MRRWTALLLGLAVAVACSRAPTPTPVAAPAPPPTPPAQPRELIVVLPDEPDGTVGALLVSVGGVEQTLDRPYAAVQTTPDGRLQVAAPSAAEVQMIFGLALGARPPRPKTYLLYFIVGTDTVTAASAQALPQILTDVAHAPAPEVMVIGHADRTGTEAQNDLLSMKRAERVRQDLIQRGVPADAIEAVGRGTREATGEAARDRRVEIVVR